MIKFADLLLEKFELPPDLEKQLENTGYSALGHILTPQIDKFRKKLFLNKELNENSYASLQNVIQTIRTMTEGEVGNTKLTHTDVLVPEYYSITEAKEIMSKIDNCESVYSGMDVKERDRIIEDFKSLFKVEPKN